MKVISKCLVVEDEKFVLIEDKCVNLEYYGTIPYSELDEAGRMKRGLNGFEMCVSFDGIASAIKQREIRVKQDRLIDKYLAEGMDKISAIKRAADEIFNTEIQ